MGWSGRRADIMEWSEKFLVYVGVFHCVCRGMGNILYIEYFTIYSRLFLNLE